MTPSSYDPDPLYTDDDEQTPLLRRRTPAEESAWFQGYSFGFRLGQDASPSLTVPLVLLCAVLTVLVAVWWVKG